ncbi:DUF4917 domain-containing protein [Helicobacter anseris]|uniref:DUF4917 domain-containing protein n=1 Tax=Helicobacter anseris TaxID=375926 RepID=A0A3D8JAG1_9HELI|nr:DUF4917 family protein [Helicobacter anseris]RDU74422.1 DUF4917 domain-containing protein [Helicobacter anseris]
MSDTLLTYDQVLKMTSENRTLLVGNGFSMAYNKNRFSFTSLLQNAVDKKIIEEDSKIYQIFKNNKTSDFEEVIKILENASKVVQIYAQDESLCSQLLNDSKSLKNFLVEIITNNHPEKVTDISCDDFGPTVDFIKDYERIYSLNYDLLLYWTTEKLREKIEDRDKDTGHKKAFVDGFSGGIDNNEGYVEFNNNSHSNTCLYLHGALHIFDDGDKIIKKTFSRTGICLKEQTRIELENNRYPIFVSEGTSEQKKTKILHNAYLNHCYKSLSSIKKGDLIVFGTILKSNDTHIQDAILENQIKTIYFGVSSLEKGMQELSDFIERAKKAKCPKEVKLYDYKSVKIWRANND